MEARRVWTSAVTVEASVRVCLERGFPGWRITEGKAVVGARLRSGAALPALLSTISPEDGGLWG